MFFCSGTKQINLNQKCMGIKSHRKKMSQQEEEEIKETIGRNGKMYYFAKHTNQTGFQRISKSEYETKKRRRRSPINKTIHVAVIGAGPVGLFFAGVLKTRLQNQVEIHIYEKRAEDKRTHAVNIVPKVLQLFEEFRLNEVLFGNNDAKACYTTTPSKSQSSKCVHKSKNDDDQGIIEIKDLQQALLKWNQTLQNTFIYETMTAELLEKFSHQYDFIIASDGKGGVTASQWLHVPRYHNEAIACGLTANFDDDDMKGSKKNNKKEKEQKQQFNYSSSRSKQYRYRGYELPTNQVYLGIQISDVELSNLETCSAKSFNELSSKLQVSVSDAARFYDLKLPTDKNQIEIALFPLRLSTLNVVQEKKNSAQIIFMGDVIVGFNFLADSGVNYGLQMAYKAAHLIHHEVEIVFKAKEYETFAKSLIKKASEKGKQVILSRIQIKELNNESESKLMELGKKEGYDLQRLSKRNTALFLSTTSH
jgi:2-polyprenyl-6-methoxyphenol hydroxylase-like FAD-dependent oxidoreductase